MRDGVVHRIVKALLVEDDMVAQTLLGGLLREYGDVDTLPSGSEAMLRLEEAMIDGHGYDLICLDIGLIDGCGTKVLERIRELEDHLGRWKEATRVVMTTGRSSPKDIVDAFKKNCDGYLVKPIGRDKLRQELDRLGLI